MYLCTLCIIMKGTAQVCFSGDKMFRKFISAILFILCCSFNFRYLLVRWLHCCVCGLESHSRSTSWDITLATENSLMSTQFAPTRFHDRCQNNSGTLALSLGRLQNKYEHFESLLESNLYHCYCASYWDHRDKMIIDFPR